MQEQELPPPCTSLRFHTTTYGGCRYSVGKLLELVPVSTPITEVRVADIIHNINRSHWTDGVGNEITPKEVLDAYRHLTSQEKLESDPYLKTHVKRILEADLRYPLIVMRRDFVVVDGLHRLVHAFINEHLAVKAYVLDVLPREGLVGTLAPSELCFDW